VAVAAVGLIAPVGARWLSPDRAPAHALDAYVVLTDVDGTANAEEREAVGFLLRTGLDMADVIQTVPAADVQRTLALMERPDGQALDGETAREVGIRLGVPGVVMARLDRLGDAYTLALRVEDAASGRLIAATQGRATDITDVVALADSLVLALRDECGETEEILARSEPLPQVLTHSLYSLMEYREALEDGPSRARQAVTHLRKAVQADTAFATAWQLMAIMHEDFLDQPDSADWARGQVMRFYDRISDARRSDMEMHQRIAEDIALWDLALAEGEAAVLRNPQSLNNWPHLNNYAVFLATIAGLGDSAAAIGFRQEVESANYERRFQPDRPYEARCWINTHLWAVSFDRLNEWRAIMDSVDIRLPPDCAREMALLESLAGAEWARADSLVRYGPGDWRWPTLVENALLQLTPLRGGIRAAHVPPSPWGSDNMVGLGGTTDLRTNIGHLLLELAYDLPLAETPEETFARRGAPRELESRGRRAVTDYVLYGVRESLLGDTAEAKRVTRRLQAMRDSATSRTFEGAFAPWFALLDAGPAYQRGDWSRVLEILEPMAARIHEPRVGSLPGDDYLIWWLLADAHAGLGNTRAAIENLEHIFERPRHRIGNWRLHGYIRPAARFRLAGLYADSGESDRARVHYRIFLDTFTDPEPEFRWMVDEAQRAGGGY
jgi:hypothetical protein